MALDIEIDQLDMQPLSVSINDFNATVHMVKDLKTYPILQSHLTDYFRDSEIFTKDLKDLKEEIVKLMNVVAESNHRSHARFLNDFLRLTETAMLHNKTIKSVAD